MKCNTVFNFGESFRVYFMEGYDAKIHITHILPSIYSNYKLICYRFYGKHKQWWHEKMCYDWELERYKKLFEEGNRSIGYPKLKR